MRPSRLRRSVPACTLLLGLMAGAAVAHGQAAVADTFASVMQAAMARMDRDMMAPASGDADRDFASMMVPHHQARWRWRRPSCASAAIPSCAAWPRASSSSSGRRSP